MDRFIGRTVLSDFCVKCDLKSNMDRFIECVINHLENITKDLKSNMDRFIVYTNSQRRGFLCI